MNFKSILQNRFIKSFGIYTIAKVINSCIPFFMLPIMTKYLSPSDYGIISMITTVAAFVLPFVSINTDSAIVRKYYDKNENISEYIGTCVILVLISCISFTAISIISAKSVSDYVKIPPFVLYFIPLYSVFTFFKTIVLYSWQVKNQPVKFGLFSIALTAMELSIAIITIVLIGMNWQGRAISLFSTALFATVFSICSLRNRNMFSVKFNGEKAKHAFKYGTGLIPHAVGASLMVLSNRFFITNMVSIEETGFYGVATQMASILSFVTLSFNNAYVPWLFDKLSKDSIDIKKKIVLLTYIYFGCLIVFAGLAYVAILLIFPIFVNESFNESMKYIPFLLVGNTLQGFYFMVTNYIMYSEKTYYNGIITIIVGLISVGCNYLLIRQFGCIGAAIAYAVTYLVYFLLTWYISNVAYKMPWLNFINRKKI